MASDSHCAAVMTDAPSRNTCHHIHLHISSVCIVLNRLLKSRMLQWNPPYLVSINQSLCDWLRALSGALCPFHHLHNCSNSGGRQHLMDVECIGRGDPGGSLQTAHTLRVFSKVRRCWSEMSHGVLMRTGSPMGTSPGSIPRAAKKDLSSISSGFSSCHCRIGNNLQRGMSHQSVK